MVYEFGNHAMTYSGGQHRKLCFGIHSSFDLFACVTLCIPAEMDGLILKAPF